MSSFLDGTGLSRLLGKIKDSFVAKSDTATVTSVSIDSTPTSSSSNLVTSGGVYNAIGNRQAKLVSGTNIRTANGYSVLGSGAIPPCVWGLGYAVCSSSASLTTKTASITNYQLGIGSTCTIKFTNACPANAKLNINSKGAKPIYLGTSQITADDIKAGDTVTLLYETTTVSTGVYRIIYIDRWKTEASGGYVNVIETVKVNGTALTPDSNKAVDVTVPTALSSLSADATHRLVTDTEKSTWNGKQAALVSGTNIKTVNNESLLGSGNISISGGGDTNVIETVKVNGTALTPDGNKAVDVTVPTALSALSDDATHRLVTDTEKSTWNGKQAALVSGTSIKTINNTSLLGSGNISIDISGKEDALVITSASGTSLSAAVGKYYYFSSSVTSLTITLPTVTGTQAKGFVVGFATGSSPSVTISTSATIYYADGYVIEANTRYELNLLWNGSYWSLSYVKLGTLS